LIFLLAGHGWAWLGRAGPSVARHGQARQGAAGHGEATHSKVVMSGVVYIAEADQMFKIGYTNLDIRKRRSAIQTMTPVAEIKIRLLIESEKPDVLESTLHRFFWHKKSRPDKAAGEWFNLTEADIQIIRDKFRGKDFENEYNFGGVGGGSPFDVCSIPGRQPYTIADGREAVSRQGSAFDFSSNQPLFVDVRGEYKKRLQTIDGQARQDNRVGDCVIHDHYSTRDPYFTRR